MSRQGGDRRGCGFPGWLLGALGLIVSVAGLYLAWIEYQESQEEKEADVVVCLRSLHYERSATTGSGPEASSVPRGMVSFRLVNSGAAEVTVTKVELNPVGTWADGRPGGMGTISIELNEVLSGQDAANVDKQFSADFSVQERFWIEFPQYVNVRANWPGGRGPMLQCSPSGNTWACGDRADNGVISVDDACQ